LINRLFALTGLAYASPGLNPAPSVPSVPSSTGPTLAAACGVAGVLVALMVRLTRRSERSPFGWFIVTAALLTSAIAFVPAAYYDHYAYFSAPFLGLALGAGTCLAVRATRSVTEGLSPTRRRLLRRSFVTVAAAAIATGVSITLAASTSTTATIVDRFGDPGPALAATVPAGACTISDAASLLVSAGRGDIGPPGCPAIVDATGMWLSISPLHPPVRAGTGYKDPKLVAIWTKAFERANYVVLSGACAFRIPWTNGLAEYFDTHFVVAGARYPLAFKRGTTTNPSERPVIRATCAETTAARRNS
jgi:hypothetical protein